MLAIDRSSILRCLKGVLTDEVAPSQHDNVQKSTKCGKSKHLLIYVADLGLVVLAQVSNRNFAAGVSYTEVSTIVEAEMTEGAGNSGRRRFE